MGEENKKKLFARMLYAFTLKAMFPGPLKENSWRKCFGRMQFIRDIVSAVLPSLKSLKSANCNCLETRELASELIKRYPSVSKLEKK